MSGVEKENMGGTVRCGHLLMRLREQRVACAILGGSPPYQDTYKVAVPQDQADFGCAVEVATSILFCSKFKSPYRGAYCAACSRLLEKF